MGDGEGGDDINIFAAFHQQQQQIEEEENAADAVTVGHHRNVFADFHQQQQMEHDANNIFADFHQQQLIPGDVTAETTHEQQNENGDDGDSSSSSSNNNSDSNAFDIWERHMTDREYKQVDKNVEVRPSPLHGLGVFVKAGRYVAASTWISGYPGIRKKYNREKFYEFGLRMGPVVFDASGPRFSSKQCIGHYVNSMHPSLPHPYNEANCYYIAVSVDIFRKGKLLRKSIRGAVHSSWQLEAGEELLADYHWFLDGKVVKNPCRGVGDPEYIQLRHDCKDCLEVREGHRLASLKEEEESKK